MVLLEAMLATIQREQVPRNKYGIVTAAGRLSIAAFGESDKSWKGNVGRARRFAAQVDKYLLIHMTSQEKVETHFLSRFPGLVHEARGLGTLCAINCRSTQTRDR